VTVGSQRAIGGMGARAGTPSFTGRLWRRPSPQSGLRPQISRPSHLEPRNCQAHMQLPSTSVWQMAAHPVPDPIDSSRHDSFSGEPDPEPIPQVTPSCAWLILDPSYLLALAGSGLRLSFLLASSSITCSRTLGTTDVALPIGSLLDESPPAEVIH